MATAVGLDVPIGPDTYHMGPGTLRISRTALHGGIRQRVLERLRAALPEGKRGVVYVKGGGPMMLYSSDTEQLFKQEAYVHYLFGVQQEDAAGAICVNTGRTTLFVPRLPDSYAVWMGRLATLDELRDKYGVDAVHWAEDAGEVLARMKPACLHVLKGENTDSGAKVEPPASPLPGVTLEEDTLLHVLNECRVFKTPEEVAIIRYANQVGARGHVAMMRATRPGAMEYGLESEFLHTCYSGGGCRSAMYVPIIASGPNGAILHYGHAGAPNDRQITPDDLILADCGCEYYQYGSDITTTFPASGRFSARQAAIYGAVLAAQRAVLAAMKPGVSWTDMQTLAYQEILTGLEAAGVVAGGTVEQYLEAELGGLFMPHGLGHFLGINTHDVGGYPPEGPARSARPGYRSLRTARLLQPGMVITVEPGCYFNPTLLLPALENPAQSKYLVREAVIAHLDLGGVRLEDNVVVTEDGCESLTHVPRSVEDVEAVMAGGAWPRG